MADTTASSEFDRAIGVDQVLEFADEHILKYIKWNQGEIQEDMACWILKMSDEALIDLMGERELNSYQRLCMPIWDYIFNQCTSRKVCEWMTENIPIDDEENLTGHLQILRSCLEDETMSPTEIASIKAELEWKPQLVDRWIAKNNQGWKKVRGKFVSLGLQKL